MRIALTNEFFPPAAPGGAEWSMFELAQTLSEAGHHVVVITPNYGHSAYELEGKVAIYRYAFPRKLKSERQLPGFIWYSNPFFYLYSAIQIYRIARKEKLQLIHAQNKYSLPGSWLAARALGIPVVTTIRDTSHICRIAVCLLKHDQVPSDCGMTKLLRECSEEYYKDYYPKKSVYLHLKDKIWQVYHWWDAHFRRFFLNSSDAVVSVSNALLEIYKNSRTIRSEKVHSQAVYNIARVMQNSKSRNIREQYDLGDSPIVLFAGKFSKGKGSDDFVEAAEQLYRSGIKATFILLGSGKSILKSDAIKTFSQLSHNETLQFISESSVIVVPSVWPEPLSRVILESLSFGKPIVGTRVGGTPEAVIDGFNGFLVPKNDPAAIVNAIEKILRDAELSARMSRNSLRMAQETFGQAIICNQVEKLYQKCVGHK